MEYAGLIETVRTSLLLAATTAKTAKPSMNFTPEQDEKYMAIALEMARRGLGRTSPNPSVGAVVVSSAEGRHIVLGRGTTGTGGTPHAEPIALSMALSELAITNAAADQPLNSACLYVTLEPCNHTGRTPPCTEAIIKAGIKRVVIASNDPDRRVSGSGIARLKQQGVEVIEGVCRKKADHINAGHFLRQTEKRPYLILKSAIASNDLIKQAKAGQPQWVTSTMARNRSHLLRAECDAILIGRTTAEQDNPSLTCRLPGMEDRSPQPIIIDQHLTLPASLKLFQKAENNTENNKEEKKKTEKLTWVICSTELSPEKMAAYQQRNVRLIPVAQNSGAVNNNNKIDLNALLEALSNEGITRLLIEGGPTTSKAFIEQTPVDQFNVFKGSEPAPEGSLLPFVDQPVTWPMETFGFTLNHQQKLGHNNMFQYQRG